MRILGKKWWTLAAALPVAALVACTSNSPVEVVTPKGQVYSEDEYEELVEQGLVDESGNVIEEDEEEDAAGGDANVTVSSSSITAQHENTGCDSGECSIVGKIYRPIQEWCCLGAIGKIRYNLFGSLH